MTNSQTMPMNAIAVTNLAPTSELVGARIQGEQDRMQEELRFEQSLRAQLDQLLLDGTDADLQELEERIAASKASQARRTKRLELLTAQKNEVEKKEATLAIDAIAVRATEQSELCKRLIGDEYPKAAKALGSLLKRLAIATAAIERDNQVLADAGRPVVPLPNAYRCTPSRRITWTERVVVTPLDPLHPDRAFAVSAGNVGVWCHSETKQPLGPVEIEIERIDILQGDSPTPLHQAITLPASEPRAHVHKTLPSAQMPAPYFDPDQVVVNEADIAELHAKFGTRKARKE